ncbi:MAG: translation initiation factor IF-2 [Nanoarchaeota archaeon]|nr:translation initiation factor IF-2 [Nanoarchaeota archaeon]
MIRQPIIAVLGHVDHGKTTLLDKIRGTAVQAKEAGGITQQIGATEIPINTIKQICGKTITGKNLTIPGLLFIDTPGHEAFTTLRERGGSIADMAVLVIDVNAGVQPQTRESIRILKTFKVPFIIALNKIDNINAWRKQETLSYAESEKKQSNNAKENLQMRVYEIMEQLADRGFDADMYTQIEDYTKTIALVPTSGISGEGISEILMLLSGLSQKYLTNKLEINTNSEGKGSILEIKEEKGLGLTIDVILYDGTLSVGDTLIIAGEKKATKTKIKALLKPAPLTELRQTKKYEHAQSVSAAAGIKIMAPNLDNIISGMPFISGAENEEKAIKELEQEIQNLLVEKEEKGIILRAESIGSLEALVKLLKENKIPVKKAGVGTVNKTDVILAAGVKEKDNALGVVFAFNETANYHAKELSEKLGVKIFQANIIYHLIEEYELWKTRKLNEEKTAVFSKITRPARIKIVSGCIFRQCNPCIVGVEIMEGILKNNSEIINEEGKILGNVKGMQNEGEKIVEAKAGEEIAISLTRAKAGKDVCEEEILYTNINENEYKILMKNKQHLRGDELNVLEKIKEIKQKTNRIWGL